MNKQINSVWVLPILMLLLSFLHWPYGYYLLLRITVTSCAGYLAYREYIQNKIMSLTVILLTFLVILFNPVIPIYFSKGVWSVFDVLAIIIFSFYAAAHQHKAHDQINSGH